MKVTGCGLECLGAPIKLMNLFSSASLVIHYHISVTGWQTTNDNPPPSPQDLSIGVFRGQKFEVTLVSKLHTDCLAVLKICFLPKDFVDPNCKKKNYNNNKKLLPQNIENQKPRKNSRRTIITATQQME